MSCCKEIGGYIVYNNYFGICGKNVEVLLKQYRNLIVDNAQAFYFPQKRVDKLL